MTTAQALTAVKRMNVAKTSMTAMQLTLGEKMTQVMSFLDLLIQMGKMPIKGQRPQAQGEL